MIHGLKAGEYGAAGICNGVSGNHKCDYHMQSNHISH
jgi:hypothetical protein